MDKTTETKVQKYETKAVGLKDEVDNLAVFDRGSYDAMLLLMEQARAFQKEIKEMFKDMKAAALAAHRGICKMEKDTLEPFLTAEQASKQAAGIWFLEEKRKADKKAREDREKLERAAEKNKAKVVAKLKKVGETDTAERLEEREVVIAPVKAVSQAAGGGFTMIDNWKARVVDVKKLSKKYMVPDVVALNKLAKSNKGEDAPAGVEFYNEPYGR